MKARSRKHRIDFNLGSIVIGALFGIPLGEIVAMERINIVTGITLLFGLLVLFSQLLMQFRDGDSSRELREFAEDLEKEKREMNNSEKDSRSG